MEAVLKLHGLIDPDAFPYQTQFGDDNIGFEQVHLLADHGLKAQDSMLAIDDALATLESETTSGRFPLISLLTVVNGVPKGWHIYTARHHAGTLQLIDPAPVGGGIYAASTADVRAAFQHTLDAVPDRQKIHILTYTEMDNGDGR